MAHVELGERIATLREEQALTQAELAERARISPSTLSQIESGRVPRPHVGTIRKIARALNVEPQDLRRAEEAALAGKAKAPREAGLADADPSSKLAPAAVLEEIAELWAEQLARGFYDRRTLGQMHMAGGFVAMNHEAAIRDVRESLPPHFLDQLEAAEDRFVAVGTQIWEAIEEADRGQAAPPDEVATRREAKREELRQQLRGSKQAGHA
jgi:transcriptional regulator with XRE-family HTH domain